MPFTRTNGKPSPQHDDFPKNLIPDKILVELKLLLSRYI